MEHLKKYVYPFFVDSLYVFVTAITIYRVTLYVKNKMQYVLQGQSARTIQQYILSLSPEQLEHFASNLRTFALMFAAAIILLPILAFLGYSYAQKVNWSFLVNSKVKFRRYCLHSLTLIVTFAVTSLVVTLPLIFVSRLPLNWLIASLYASALYALWSLFTLTSYKYFARSGKIFSSYAYAADTLSLRTFLKAYVPLLSISLLPLYLIQGGSVLSILLLLAYISYLRVTILKLP